ncbi:BTB/POZ domain-containing protein KCTD19 isoform X2 [Crotalus tigris]|uniref:BTB/POZ domain-containing protein KCTD19 isoform X2 n=1 Tax=Crotalus tigris TaxID=88082 RepID=UPI00192F53CB|nr:BTB/POZ domain-containing protein KCTD19 isoform X2 [Crotalus tigris]
MQAPGEVAGGAVLRGAAAAAPARAPRCWATVAAVEQLCPSGGPEVAATRHGPDGGEGGGSGGGAAVGAGGAAGAAECGRLGLRSAAEQVGVVPGVAAGPGGSGGAGGAAAVPGPRRLRFPPRPLLPAHGAAVGRQRARAAAPLRAGRAAGPGAAAAEPGQPEGGQAQPARPARRHPRGRASLAQLLADAQVHQPARRRRRRRRRGRAQEPRLLRVAGTGAAGAAGHAAAGGGGGGALLLPAAAPGGRVPGAGHRRQPALASRRRGADRGRERRVPLHRLDSLEAEAEALGIPKVIEAVKIFRNNPGSGSSEASKSPVQQQRLQDPSVLLPLYPMVLGLLVKYPDSALGPLHMESTLDGNKLYISGNGVLFQHVMNWLGTCRLPLTRNMSELPHLCTYLDQMDLIYEPMKDALKRFLNPKTPTDSLVKNAEWAAEITAFSLHHIVKVYVGSHWYATYLQTLLKFPELLSNCKKVYWIAYGQSLLIHGDGKMFRHVLNFLRLGKLYLPSEFKEWSLLCQEVIEYQIPSLLEALYQYDMYRSWLQQKEAQHVVYPVRNLESLISEEDTGSNKVLRDHLHFADLDQCANNWNITREPQSMEGSDRENTKYTSISPIKGAKRKHPWETSKSSDDWGDTCLFRQEGNPPKKRAKGSLTKPLENSDPPIQKLISLVQGWDMAHCRCCGAPQGPESGEESKWRALSGRIPQASCFRISSSELSSNEVPIQGAPDHLSKAELCKQGALPLQGWLAKADEPSNLEEVPSSGKGASSREQSGQKEKGTALEETAICEALDMRGWILKVEHPPIVPGDGSCVFHEGSVLYSTGIEEITLACALAPPVDKDVVFLSFPLTQEEIFYAQKCHGFLTDVILDSIRQKDPKETTAKVERLVQRLWRLQITAKEFVAELLNSAPFIADGHSYEKLLKWVEFTLPFAWKYSCCINLLIKKGYFKSLSHFVIGKYLQNP